MPAGSLHFATLVAMLFDSCQARAPALPRISRQNVGKQGLKHVARCHAARQPPRQSGRITVNSNGHLRSSCQRHLSQGCGQAAVGAAVIMCVGAYLLPTPWRNIAESRENEVQQKAQVPGTIWNDLYQYRGLGARTWGSLFRHPASLTRAPRPSREAAYSAKLGPG